MIYRRIAAELRTEILNGRFKSGTRLPTREALIRQFDTTSFEKESGQLQPVAAMAEYLA